MSAPILFALPAQRSLLPAELRADSTPQLGTATVTRFANGELWAQIEDPVEARVCAVLGSLAPPDEQMLSLLLLAHTLKRAGASRVVALLPYLGYGRQDRAGRGHSVGVAWTADLLAGAGVDRVLTVDVHSARAAACFSMGLESLSPAPLFAHVLVRQGVQGLTIVAPDEGALPRCQALAAAAGIAAPLAHMRKRREEDGAVHSTLLGSVTPRVVLVDDILDTGSTLVSACAELRRAGVREITVFATHGLFTGRRWCELPALGVVRIFITDSVPTTSGDGCELVETIPVGPLMIDAFAELARTEPGFAEGEE